MAADLGLDATGVDLAAAALQIATEKARDRGCTARFLLRDARTLARLAIRRRRTAKAPRVRGQDGGGTVTHKPITRSEARVPTPRGERYAKQLCRHAAWKTPRAEWTPPDGVIEFPDDMGTCRITAEPDHLVLAVEATDPANLARMQQIVGGNVERFAGRERLKVEWLQDRDR